MSYDDGRWSSLSGDVEFAVYVNRIDGMLDDTTPIGYEPDRDLAVAIRMVEFLGGRVFPPKDRPEHVPGRVY